MNPLDKLPPDKARHFIGGALVAAVAGALAMRSHAALAWQIAIAVALGFGVAKEAADYALNRRAMKAGLAPPHGVEAMDALATTAGGVVVALPLFVAWLITR